jgi:hypothetical protein
MMVCTSAIVAVGVFEEKNLGLRGDEHAAIPELKSQSGLLHLGELGHAIGALPSLLSSWQMTQRVLASPSAAPTSDSPPHGDPEAALGIELHLHRIHELWELRCSSAKRCTSKPFFTAMCLIASSPLM